MRMIEFNEERGEEKCLMDNYSEILIYQSEDGLTNIQVRACIMKNVS